MRAINMDRNSRRFAFFAGLGMTACVALLFAVVYLLANFTTNCASADSCGVGDSETFARGIQVNTSGASDADADTVINTDTLAAITCDAGTDACAYLGTHDYSGAIVNGVGTLQGIEVITTTSTYNVPTDVSFLVVYSMGAGAGGGGFNSTTTPNYPGTGGAGGSTAVCFIDVGVTTSFAVTIGAAGTGGAANADGVAGGNTTFAALCQGNGGGPGFFAPGFGGLNSGCTTSTFCINGGDGFAFNNVDAAGNARALGGGSWRAGPALTVARGVGGPGGFAGGTAGLSGGAGSVVIFEYQ